mgnify:CR=1 FL=1
MKREIKLANPRGFCAGVDRAIEIVNQALLKFGPPVYVRHEVVHNRNVVEDLKSKGAIFVEQIDEIPEGAITIFSAHGVSKKVVDDAETKNLNYFDATCPLVTKVHMEVIRYARQGLDIILVGHDNHPEVEGTLGRFPHDSKGKIYLVESEIDAKNIEIDQPSNLAMVTQTTLSVDDTKSIINILKKRFPKLISPSSDDICYATQNRQDAVKQLALETDFIIVVGSENSSNSNRLKELAELMGTQSCLVDHVSQLSEDSLKNISKLGITSGASAPEELVKEIISYCKGFGFSIVEEIQGLKENISFKLPKELR